MTPICTATSKSGLPCPRKALPERERCHLHDPEATLARAKKGGRPKKERVPASASHDAKDVPLDVDLTTQAGVARALHETARAVVARRLTPAAGSAISKMASLALKALDDTMLRRLEELEAKLGLTPKGRR
jgi:hypothetical protein